MLFYLDYTNEAKPFFYKTNAVFDGMQNWVLGWLYDQLNVGK